MPAGMTFEEAAAICDGRSWRLEACDGTTSGRGSGSSSTAPLAPSARQVCSWPSPLALTLQRCANELTFRECSPSSAQSSQQHGIAVTTRPSRGSHPLFVRCSTGKYSVRQAPDEPLYSGQIDRQPVCLPQGDVPDPTGVLHAARCIGVECHQM
jgi:hypothetical protein